MLIYNNDKYSTKLAVFDIFRWLQRKAHNCCYGYRDFSSIYLATDEISRSDKLVIWLLRLLKRFQTDTRISTHKHISDFLWGVQISGQTPQNE